MTDLASVTDAAHVRPGDEARIAVPLDFLGVNYYTRHVVRAGDAGSGPSPWPGCDDVAFTNRGLPVTEMGWEIDPDGFHEVLVRLRDEYPPVPLYVTENGAAFPDRTEPDGTVHDADRVAFLEGHFRAAHRAIGDGVDLRGYFVWSLLDNFEWAYGYAKRFGLVHVDYDTLERTPKESARWYAAVTARNGVAPAR
jgi:beta-glucosidase